MDFTFCTSENVSFWAEGSTIHYRYDSYAWVIVQPCLENKRGIAILIFHEDFPFKNLNSIQNSFYECKFCIFGLFD